MRVTSSLLLTLSLLALSCGCRSHPSKAEAPATYLDFDEAKLLSHIITWPPPLRLSKEEWDKLTDVNLTKTPCGGAEYLSYLLHISAQGTVEEAILQPYQSWCNNQKNPSDPPAFIKKHLTQAESLLKEAHFRPWIINGHPTPVLVQMSIAIAPPEKYGSFLSFPKPVDLSSVTITMQHRGCEGRCPAYNVSIRGDGTVEYQGYAYVAIKGKQIGHITREAVSELIHQFDEANFFSALPEYVGAYDSADVLLKLDVNHTSHTVFDGSGLRVGLPTSVKNLEWLIDQTTDTHHWVYSE